MAEQLALLDSPLPAESTQAWPGPGPAGRICCECSRRTGVTGSNVCHKGVRQRYGSWEGEPSCALFHLRVPWWVVENTDRQMDEAHGSPACIGRQERGEPCQGCEWFADCHAAEVKP